MRRVAVSIVFAAIFAGICWLILSQTFPSAQSQGFLGFLSGFAVSLAFYLAQELGQKREPADEQIVNDEPSTGTLGYRSILIILITLNFGLLALVQALSEGLSEILQQPGVTNADMYPHIWFQIAGNFGLLIFITMAVASFLIGIAARSTRYSYFLVAALLPDLVLGLPRIFQQDPVYMTGLDILEALTGYHLEPNAANGFFATAAIVALQLGVLVATTAGASLIWWILAKMGVRLRSSLLRRQASGISIVGNAPTSTPLP